MRHGGRQKGTPNKKTQALEEICEKHGVNVFEAMVMLAKEAMGETKFKYLSEIAQYLYPKRKQVEVETGENGFIVKIENYIKK